MGHSPDDGDPLVTGRPVVASLYRYPVKSLLGERVTQLDVDPRGCRGDRLWSARTRADKIGSGKTTNRFAAVARLLELRAGCDGDDVLVTFPDGTSYRVDDPAAAQRLSELAGEPLTFARETGVSHFDDGPVSLIGAASVAALADARGAPVEVARFRPNMVIAGSPAYAEEGWVGRSVQVGSARLRVTMVSPRCVMIDMRTAELAAQPGNLKTLGRLRDACLGVIASVERPGTISVGDEVVPVSP